MRCPGLGGEPFLHFLHQLLDGDLGHGSEEFGQVPDDDPKRFILARDPESAA
jgi:hypothetical protein